MPNPLTSSDAPDLLNKGIQKIYLKNKDKNKDTRPKIKKRMNMRFLSSDTGRVLFRK